MFFRRRPVTPKPPERGYCPVCSNPTPVLAAPHASIKCDVCGTHYVPGWQA